MIFIILIVIFLESFYVINIFFQVNPLKINWSRIDFRVFSRQRAFNLIFQVMCLKS
jgi:flagellar biosynthesis protein FlhB